MKVRILNPESVVFEAETDKIVLPALEGEITILPHHISIITALKKGRLSVHLRDKKIFQQEVAGGVCSFSDERAAIILDEGQW